MPFDPEAEPWLNARILIAEHGEEAIEEVWRLGRQFRSEGRDHELSKLVAVLTAILAMRRLS